ncbi:protein Wnt-7a-like [Helicoverpa armigera]|uniref:protein Wnt-7a-like n=1 Tax=Helicoverpa armigera TaxID=29058 RepID=UPI003083A22A
MLECVRGARTVVRARPPRAHTRPGPLLLLLALLHCVRVTACGGSLGAALVCARAPGLTERQRALCRQAPAAVAAIGEGLRMAYAECRAQLAGRRWNCSGVGDSQHFGHVMPIGEQLTYISLTY